MRFLLRRRALRDSCFFWVRHLQLHHPSLIDAVESRCNCCRRSLLGFAAGATVSSWRRRRRNREREKCRAPLSHTRSASSRPSPCLQDENVHADSIPAPREPNASNPPSSSQHPTAANWSLRRVWFWRHHPRFAPLPRAAHLRTTAPPDTPPTTTISPSRRTPPCPFCSRARRKSRHAADYPPRHVISARAMARSRKHNRRSPPSMAVLLPATQHRLRKGPASMAV